MVQRLECIFASVLDVSSVVVVPLGEMPPNIPERSLYPCVFFNPATRTVEEKTGIKIRLQNTFPNIRENRHLAWICTDFTRCILMKLEYRLTMKIVYKTQSSELIARLYTIDSDTVKSFSRVYPNPLSSSARRHVSIVDQQLEAFGDICMNDIIQNYTDCIIESTREKSIENLIWKRS